MPDAVYALLAELARRAPRPLTVILERDGDYPRMEILLAQLDRARAALAEGRSARVDAAPPADRERAPRDAALPERALARLYVEPDLRRRLGRDTADVARELLPHCPRSRARSDGSTAAIWSSPPGASRASARDAALPS